MSKHKPRPRLNAVEESRIHIIYFDVRGAEVGREPVANAKRYSMEASMNQRKMAAFKKAHPQVVRAHCAGCRFSFTAAGESWMEAFLPRDQTK